MLSGIERIRLSNGMTLLLKSDHRLPLACILTWVNTGYFDETDDQVGISHVLEHMFFKGTPTRGANALAEQTKALGGYLNAATYYDHTYYYTVVPSCHVLPALKIQADALQNPLFDPHELEKEKEVVIHEVRKKLDNPSPYAWEKLLELSYEKHRIRRWRIGHEEELRKFSREQVWKYYGDRYTPDNITLVVIGDFKKTTLLPHVERLYSSMKGSLPPSDPPPQEPDQQAPRMKRLMGDISQAFLKIGFQTPGIQHPDFPSLSVFNILLGRGRSSRLYRFLKEENEWVHGVGSYLFTAREVGFLTFEAELRPENLATSEEEIWKELDRLRREPPREEEVKKARNIVEANFFYGKEDLLGQALHLAYFEGLGGYEKSVEYINRMRNVTSQDVVHVYETYVQPSRMNLLEYVPSSVGEGALVSDRLESLLKRIQRNLTPLTESISFPQVPPAPPFLVQGKETSQPGTPEIISLSQGITLLHLKVSNLPLVSLSLYFPGGRLDETPQNCGLTQFLLKCSLKGTHTRTAEELHFALESLGSTLRVEAQADSFGYSMNLLSRDFDRGLELLSDVVLHPSFQASEIEKEKKTTIAEIQRLRDDMFRYPIELFYRALFGVHPYGLPRNGEVETVSSFSSLQLQEWYSQIFQWKKMTVVVVGDIERDPTMEKVNQWLGGKKEGGNSSRAQIFPVVPASKFREAVEERIRKQTGMALGFSSVPLKDSRYYALEVLRNILSGMGGRLFVQLREKNSLAYSVTAFHIGLLRSGAFFAYVGTSPHQESLVREKLMEEFLKVRDEPLSDEEVAIAKNFSIGSHSISMQGNSRLSMMYLQHWLAGNPLQAVTDYPKRIEQVSKKEIQSVAREIMNEKQLALGMVRGVSK